MSARLLALLLVAGSASYGAEREFDRVVKAIEKHYGVERTHVPLMGLAHFFVQVAHPAGATGFQLAVFEDLPDAAEDRQDLDRLLAGLGGGLHPLVVTRDRRSGQASYILAGEAGKRTKLLIASFERREATVIEVEADIDLLMKVLNRPEDAAGVFRGGADSRY